jgi:hypothetical protein
MAFWALWYRISLIFTVTLLNKCCLLQKRTVKYRQEEMKCPMSQTERGRRTGLWKYKVHGLHHKLLCLLSTVVSLGSGKPPFSSTSYPFSPALPCGASGLSLLRKGWALRKGSCLLCSLKAAQGQDLDPCMSSTLLWAQGAEAGWLLQSFHSQRTTAQERWPSGNNLPDVPLATHFVDFLKCVFLWGFCFFSGLVCDFTSFLFISYYLAQHTCFHLIFFPLSDSWPTWPAAHFAIQCAILSVSFVWSLWKPKLKRHDKGMIQAFQLRQRPSCERDSQRQLKLHHLKCSLLS